MSKKATDTFKDKIKNKRSQLASLIPSFHYDFLIFIYAVLWGFSRPLHFWENKLIEFSGRFVLLQRVFLCLISHEFKWFEYFVSINTGYVKIIEKRHYFWEV